MIKKPLGIVLWRGKSLIDHKRIMVIATGVFENKSLNGKTGEMIQTYILRRDIDPMLARRMGGDKSICGYCKHREKSTCYVNLCHGPIKIYEAYQDNRYRDYVDSDIQYFKDRSIRIGSYGDPAVIPFEIWDNICKIAKSQTGYTHLWKTCDQRLKNYCMASVDSIQGYMNEFEEAQKMSWRTFRIRESYNNELRENEIVCPASKEIKVKTTCEKCNMCNGLVKPNCKNPVIILHGDLIKGNTTLVWRKHRYLDLMKKIKNKKQWRRDYRAENKRFKEVCPF